MYEKRVLLFLDILGFKELVSQGEAEKILSALKLVSKHAEEIENRLSINGTCVTSFSDCIVISHPVESGRAGMFVTMVGAYLALELLRVGIITRGGVSVGDVLHQSKILFGPAMIEAYLLESKMATYPRILVSKEVRDLALNEHRSKFQKDGIHPDEAESLAFDYFRQDFDGLWHVNILCPESIHPPAFRSTKSGASATNTFREVATHSILSACGAPRDSNVAPKYDWLLNYFKATCERYDWPTN